MTGLYPRLLLCAGAALALVLPASAQALAPTTDAQITSATFTTLTYSSSRDEKGTTAYMGIDECVDAVREGEDIVVRFATQSNLGQEDATGVVPFQGGFYFGVDRDSTTSVNCSTDNDTCDGLETDTDVVVGENTVTATVDFSRLTGITSEEECTTAGVDKEFFVRINFQPDSTVASTATADVRIILDTIRPDAPESFEAVLTESAVKITWVDDTPSGDLEGYAVYTSAAPIPGDTLAEDLDNLTRLGVISSNSNNSGTLDADLEPNAQLYVTIAAQDEAGNLSEVLDSNAATVLDTVDFWEGYKAAGGEEEGGCAHTPSKGPLHMSWLVLVGLVGIAARGAKRLHMPG